MFPELKKIYTKEQLGVCAYYRIKMVCQCLPANNGDVSQNCGPA